MKSKLGIIGYSNKSGLGNLIKNFRKNLNIECQFIINHSIKGVDLNIGIEYAVGDLEPTIEQFNQFLAFKPTTVIIVETPFNWEFIPLMKSRGIRIIYIPMIDCLKFSEIKYKEQIDSFIMLNRIGFATAIQNRIRNAEFTNYPVDTDYFEFKERDTNLFLHNAGYYELVKGNVDLHKGTDVVIEVFKHLKDKTLLINSMTEIPDVSPNVIVHMGEFEEAKDAYKMGSIYLAPSRWEGLGLPLYEAMASGMALITTNGPPMNELPINNLFKVSCSPFTIPHGLGVGYWPDQVSLERIVNMVSGYDIKGISYKNRDIIEKYYSWKVLKDNYERIIYGR